MRYGILEGIFYASITHWWKLYSSLFSSAKRNNSGIHFTRWLWGLNELIHINDYNNIWHIVHAIWMLATVIIMVIPWLIFCYFHMYCSDFIGIVFLHQIDYSSGWAWVLYIHRHEQTLLIKTFLSFTSLISKLGMFGILSVGISKYKCKKMQRTFELLWGKLLVRTS